MTDPKRHKLDYYDEQRVKEIIDEHRPNPGCLAMIVVLAAIVTAALLIVGIGIKAQAHFDCLDYGAHSNIAVRYRSNGALDWTPDCYAKYDGRWARLDRKDWSTAP